MENDWYKTCTTCGGPADGYVINETDKLSWCETCYDRDELPKLQAQYPDNYMPILILFSIVGINVLAMVLFVAARVVTCLMGR